MTVSRIRLVLLALLVPLTAALPTSPARAFDFSHVTGTVTGTAGTPLTNVDVIGYYNDPEEGWTYAGDANTSATGSYDLLLGEGTYRILYQENDVFDEPQYQPEYWDDAAAFEDSDDVVLAAGETVTGHDVQLSPWGRISGQVTSTTGAGVPSYIEVYRYSAADDYWDAVDSWDTDATGHYTVTDLRAGTYRLEVRPDGWQYADEFWQDAATVETATDIVVGRGAHVTGINPVVNASSHITGRVTGPNGAGLSHVEVNVYVEELWVDDDGSVDSYWETYWDDNTDANGSYDIRGLKAGTYRVQFNDFSGDFFDEYWNDRRSVETAHDVVVGQSATRSSINAVLAPWSLGPVRNLKAPTIQGTARVGSRLSVGGAKWNPGKVSITYQWRANGKAIRKATGKTFTPKARQLGKKISVTLKASAEDYDPLLVTTKSTRKVQAALSRVLSGV